MALYLAELRCGLQRVHKSDQAVPLQPPQQPVIVASPIRERRSQENNEGTLEPVHINARDHVQVLICLHSLVVAPMHKDQLDEFTALHMFLTVGDRTEHRVVQLNDDEGNPKELSTKLRQLEESFMFTLPQPLPKLSLFLSGEGEDGDLKELGKCTKSLPVLKPGGLGSNMATSESADSAMSSYDHITLPLTRTSVKKTKKLKAMGDQSSDDSVEAMPEETSHTDKVAEEAVDLKSKIKMSLTTISPHACARVIRKHKEEEEAKKTEEPVRVKKEEELTNGDSMTKLRAVAE
jgi:hypothetical protein